MKAAVDRKTSLAVHPKTVGIPISLLSLVKTRTFKSRRDKMGDKDAGKCCSQVNEPAKT